MKNKKRMMLFMALAAVLGLMAGVYMTALPQTNAGEKDISITVVHGDDSVHVFDVKTSAEYLGEELLAMGIVEGEQTEYGLMISAVDGEVASWEENQSYWAILVEGEYASTGADGIALTDGGEYSFVYTIG